MRSPSKTFDQILAEPGARNAWEKVSPLLSGAERECFEKLLVGAANGGLFSSEDHPSARTLEDALKARKMTSRKMARHKNVVKSLTELIPPASDPSAPSGRNLFLWLYEGLRMCRERGDWSGLSARHRERLERLLEEAGDILPAVYLQFPGLSVAARRLPSFPPKGFQRTLRGVLRAYGDALERIDTSKIRRGLEPDEALTVAVWLARTLRERLGGRGHYEAVTTLVNAALGAQLDPDSLIKAVNVRHGQPAS